MRFACPYLLPFPLKIHDKAPMELLSNVIFIIESNDFFEKDIINSQKILARFARPYLLPFPLRIHDIAPMEVIVQRNFYHRIK